MNVVLDNLKKCFGQKVAVDIDHYEIESGTILGLVGNNGAGKSTLFRLMLDLLKADNGHVMLGNYNPANTEEWKDFTGAYIDEGFLIDYLTPDEYFHFVGKISGATEDQVDEKLLHFEHFMAGECAGQQKLIRDLSAGNKRKVGIVAAMLLEPQVLILDEPFNFLDPSSQSAMKHLLVDYNKEKGATILVSSHNLQHTVDISSRIALLEDGRIIRDIDNNERQATQELESYFDG